MLLSFGLILLSGVLVTRIMKHIGLPPLTGMLLAGILLGPAVLNWIDPAMLEISGSIRKIALLVILIRAGLSLRTEDLIRAGRPALLLCFVPATCEILAFLLLGPPVFGLSLLESAILGTVIAAVGPAVVVPGMVTVMKSGYGQDKAIAPMILAGASADDIFVIVLFSIFTSMAGQGGFHWQMLLRIPTSIVLGILSGILLGILFVRVFHRVRTPVITRLIVFLATGALLYALEDALTGPVGFSGLIAVMTTALVAGHLDPPAARRLGASFDSLWTAAQIFLFTLIGAAIQLTYAAHALGPSLLLIAAGLLCRSGGVLLCLTGTSLNWKERLFSVVSYLPKATVQAAISAIPLSMGLACGQTVLTVAVLAILVTAPLGAAAIDLLYPRLLHKPDA
ncbi:cation:proton antiporter [Faecalibaculum rodentium]|uniref:cation:proton antiporter n=1 Tax=Faecalibaculum rodentium TaxID=1702221 RepID=UPI00256E9FE0|nr:cation:proton antiporter [Faecalibaculum rodentium]